MSEAPHNLRDYARADRLEDLLPDLVTAAQPPLPVQPEQRGFELPGRIWQAMIACYALFFTAIIAALGSSGEAMLSILVALAYVVIFFGTARIVLHQNPARVPSPLDSEGVLATWCGPMDRKAVYGQILVVPVAVALFGIAVAVIIIASGAAV